MPSSLFGNPNPQSNNLIDLIQRFNEFKQSMQGKDPQAMVNNLLQSGQMTQEQFNSLKNTAQSLASILK